MKPQLRNVLIIGAVAVLAFAGGAVWQFSQARQARQALDTTRQELKVIQGERAVDQLEASLTSATMAAEFGNFERSRQLASDFFDRLQEQAGTVPESARSGLGEILARRDDVITMLSRRQPESGFELATMLTSLQRALGKEPTLAAPQQSAPTEPERE